MKFVISFICSMCLVCGLRANDIIANKKNEILREHNKFRSFHGVPNLERDQELEKSAQSWAEYLAEKNNALIRVKTGKFGENLWMVEGAHIQEIMNDTLNPVKDWYTEKKSYPGRYDETSFTKYGHFTQIVWKDTKKLGVGIAVSNNGNIYVVCDYDPRGNIIEEFETNVFPVLNEFRDRNETDIRMNSVKSGQHKINFNWMHIMFSVLSIYVLN